MDMLLHREIANITVGLSVTNLHQHAFNPRSIRYRQQYGFKLIFIAFKDVLCSVMRCNYYEILL